MPATFLIDLKERNDFLIEIKKDKGIFKEGKIYDINIELLKEVNEELWKVWFKKISKWLKYIWLR